MVKSVAAQTASAEPWLRRVEEVNRRAGFLAWDPQKLAVDPVGDPGPGYPRLHPATPASPRLFIAYGWSRDQTHDAFETDVWIDAFAGFLFNRGYDIVFDRDPRNFAKGLNWLQVLTRMNDCNYFVPIVTEQWVARVTSASPVGPAPAEWKHAKSFFPARLTMIGVWRSGLLPEPLRAENTVDVRAGEMPWADAISDMFPEAEPGKKGVPKLAAPQPLPDPPQWPKLKPY
ncbi:MAG: hypothetical protein JNK04_06325 [Myxococcales bacterium]|nr:hypothetical protein [Myxococcales bacterium]